MRRRRLLETGVMAVLRASLVNTSRCCCGGDNSTAEDIDLFGLVDDTLTDKTTRRGNAVRSTERLSPAEICRVTDEALSQADLDPSDGDTTAIAELVQAALKSGACSRSPALLRGRRLRHVTLSHVQLPSNDGLSRMEWCDATWCGITCGVGADLSHSLFQRVVFDGCRLLQCRLDAATFSDCVFVNETKFEGVSLTRCLFRNCRFGGSCSAVFEACDFDLADIAATEVSSSPRGGGGVETARGGEREWHVAVRRAVNWSTCRRYIVR